MTRRMRAHIRAWVKGLVAGVISQISSGLLLVIVDPQRFQDWGILWRVAAANAVVAAILYLKKSPLPE